MSRVQITSRVINKGARVAGFGVEKRPTAEAVGVPLNQRWPWIMQVPTSAYDARQRNKTSGRKDGGGLS
jgi:hypothetical protein